MRGLFGIAFLVFAMAFEWDKRNNPAEPWDGCATRIVARVVQLEEMNWGPAIPKSKLGAAFTMRFRATVSRINRAAELGHARKCATPGRAPCSACGCAAGQPQLLEREPT